MADQANSAASPAPLLPLFYNDLQPLHAERHAAWRLKQGDASFASETPYVPIVVGELAAAARSYPVVFAADGAQPIAILGLERRNLFFGDDGHWVPDTYVPAYVRRYPFAFIGTVKPDGFALAIDAGAERVVQSGSDGAALFENGKPSALTREALDFCAAFGRDAELTQLFATALQEKELLIDRRADATLLDGRKLGLDGFQIVDAEKFAALADHIVLDWHRRGWLALVHFHLASLDCFSDLLVRQSKRQPVAAMSHQNGSDAETAAATRPAKSKKG